MIKKILFLCAFITLNTAFAQTICKRLVTTFDYSTSTGYSIQGSAELKDSLGTLYLTFSSDFSTSSGPDLYVYLTETGAAPTAIGNDDYEIAPLISNSGAQSYTLPSTVALGDYEYVTIHCKQYNHLWNSGLLGPESCFTYPTYSNINVEECFSYTSPSGNSIWTNTGIYSDTLVGMNAGGGDSIITIDLTVNIVSTDVTRMSNTLEFLADADNSTFQWINCVDNSDINGETNASFTPTVSGDYAVVITSQGNCVDTSYCFSVIVTEECLNYTPPSGNGTWTSSGIYSDTLMGEVSVIDLTLHTVDVNVTQSSVTNDLTAEADNSTFQWINCADNSVINGETNSSFTPNEVGEFAVIVTSSNNCVDTSACYTIHTVGIENHKIEVYSVYPNPSFGNITIQTKDMNAKSIRVYNMLNQRIPIEVLVSSLNTATIGMNVPNGIYNIHFENINGDAKTVKVIKN